MIPPRWWVVTVRTAAPWDGDLLPTLLLESGARGVVEEGDGHFSAPFEPPDDPESEAVRLRAFLQAESGLDDLEVTWLWQPHADWESLWREGLRPRRITPRITVAPSWDIPDPAPGEQIVVLDPGMAFGTAEHATTRGCLRLLDGTLAPGERVADIGTGSAILAVAAALLGAAHVRALEADPWAVDAARENVVRNGVEDRVRVEQALVDLSALAALHPLDGILANIERGVVVPLLPGFREALEEGGWLILSGIEEGETAAVVDAASREGFTPLREDREEGWTSLLLRRGPDPAPIPPPGPPPHG